MAGAQIIGTQGSNTNSRERVQEFEENAQTNGGAIKKKCIFDLIITKK